MTVDQTTGRRRGEQAAARSGWTRRCGLDHRAWPEPPHKRTGPISGERRLLTAGSRLALPSQRWPPDGSPSTFATGPYTAGDQGGVVSGTGLPGGGPSGQPRASRGGKPPLLIGPQRSGSTRISTLPWSIMA